MKRKKAKVFGIVILIITFAILLTIWSFNPDRDVCTKYKKQICYKDLPLEMEAVKCPSEYCTPFVCDGECLEWRPKTKCELNPNDEGCVCDEYEQLS